MCKFITIENWYPARKDIDGKIWPETFKEIFINCDDIHSIKEINKNGKICCEINCINGYIYFVIGKLDQFEFILSSK